MTPLLLGLVAWPEELDLPLLGLDLVPVLFQLLLGGHVRVGHRLEERDGTVKPLWGARASLVLPYGVRSYLHGPVALACGPPLRKLFLDGGKRQRELLQADLLL